jgi:DNA-binding NtrC family response regulator
MAKLLVVDDEQSMRQLLSLVFGREGYEVRTARTGREALEILRLSAVDVIISDVKMPDMSGIELLREVRAIAPDTPVIMMTAFATIETAREAFKLGADDFVQKPFDVDELKEIVRRAFDKLQLVEENRAFRRAQAERGRLDQIIGRSRRMQAVYQMIEQVAPLNSTVLITGESGTGKELVARAIHNLSPRADKPFVSVNCGAFTETLLESELFGYRKGAFTGATQNRKGLFEAAGHGTIFLDEVGEMSPAMQVKLLRVLQERKVRPLGSPEEIATEARVIAATNRDLAKMVKQGAFREDLYYRISVIPIEIPPLRERREDIPLLVEHFLEKFCAQTGKRLKISTRALALLESYSWPGNVRELEHTIERAVALEPTEEIQPERLPDPVRNEVARTPQTDFTFPEEGISLFDHLNALERAYVIEALRRTGGNQTRAAELLHIPVRSLRHLIDKHEIRALSAQLRSEAARGAE